MTAAWPPPLQASQLRIEQADALRWMGRAEPAGFDLVMLDPPFGAGLFDAALQAAARLLAASGCIYLEADRPFGEADLAPLALAVHRAGHAGRVFFHLLRPALVQPTA